LLEEGIAKYEKSLSSNLDTKTHPYSLLNQSQLLIELSSLQRDLGLSQAALNRQKALTLLRELDNKYPEFEFKNEALYFRAIALEAGSQPQEAISIWNVLATSTKEDKYSLYANLAAGDFDFENANPNAASKRYERANVIYKSISGDLQSRDYVRIQYRIGWAAYKATNHKKAIESARILLNPAVYAKATRQSDKIIKDTCELVGFSLFELDDMQNFKSTIGACFRLEWIIGICSTSESTNNV
jgi:tetratricopeptide (TPR) repeat protein